MQRPPVSLSRDQRAVAILLLASLIACAQDGDSTGVPNSSVEEAEIVVSAVDPDTATVDTMVTVRISGSGFTEGSTATWVIDTMAAAEIRTISTTWKSPSEVEAIIVISPDAELRPYSIRIRGRGKKGKQGIAVERFRVVAKPVPLPEPGVRSEAVDVNDSDVIVGNAIDASGQGVAIQWTPVDSGWSYSILGPGSAMAINNEGLVIRQTYDPLARSHRSWVHLPSGPTVDLGPVLVTDISDNGTIIGTVVDATFRSIAVAWKRVTAGSWGTPQPLPIPPGYSGAGYSDINANGDVAGVLTADAQENVGAVWKYRDGQWLMPELVDQQLIAGAAVINNAGALAGSVWPCVRGSPTCYASPAFWLSAGGARRILPTLYNSQGLARGMNNLNQVVGSARVHYSGGSSSLAALVTHAVIWFELGQWPEDLGAIRQWENGSAAAINDHGLVVGFVREHEAFPYNAHATIWQLPRGMITAPPSPAQRR